MTRLVKFSGLDFNFSQLLGHATTPNENFGGGGGGVTMHFSEILKLQFEENCRTLLYTSLFFRIIVASLSLKNAWLPPPPPPNFLSGFQ